MDHTRLMIESLRNMNQRKLIYEQDVKTFQNIGEGDSSYKTHSTAISELVTPNKVEFSDIQKQNNIITWKITHESGIVLTYDSTRRNVFLSADSVDITSDDLDKIKKIVTYLKTTFSNDNNL